MGFDATEYLKERNLAGSFDAQKYLADKGLLEEDEEEKKRRGLLKEGVAMMKHVDHIINERNVLKHLTSVSDLAQIQDDNHK